jgi:hypothetical protein
MSDIKLPDTRTEADTWMLDHITTREALIIARSVMTNEQKNTVITSAGGARVTVSEIIDTVLEA